MNFTEVWKGEVLPRGAGNVSGLFLLQDLGFAREGRLPTAWDPCSLGRKSEFSPRKRGRINPWMGRGALRVSALSAAAPGILTEGLDGILGRNPSL